MAEVKIFVKWNRLSSQKSQIKLCHLMMVLKQILSTTVRFTLSEFLLQQQRFKRSIQ